MGFVTLWVYWTQTSHKMSKKVMTQSGESSVTEGWADRAIIHSW